MFNGKNWKNSNEILYKNVYYNEVSSDTQPKWIFYRIEHKSILIHILGLLDKSLFMDSNHSSIREIHFRYLMFELGLNSHSIFSNSSILIF